MSIIAEAQRIQQAKADIKSALEAKGIAISADTPLDDYAALITAGIPTPPSADGNYTLSLTVSNGEFNYGTWTSAT